MPTNRRSRRPGRIRAAVCLIGSLVVVSATASAEPRIGYLRCLSEPQGAYVFLDEKWIGVTPLGPIGVAAGPHSVWFRSRPGVEFEPSPLEPRDIVIAVGDTTRVTERMGHLLWIESAPSGAPVERDGRIEGATPLQIRVDPERTQSITVGGDRYRRKSLDLSRITERERILVSLRTHGFDDAPGGTASPSRLQTWAPWTSLFVAAGSAVVAVHFKARADDAFEQYEKSLLLDDLERWRDRAERDDRYATAAWIVAESALAVGVYLLAKPLLGGRARVASGAADHGIAEPRLRMDVTPDRARVGARWSW